MLRPQALLPLVMGLLLITACGPEVIFEKKIDISSSDWSYSDTLRYEFEIADTNRLYNLFLQLDHSTEFSKQNLYVKMYTGFPNGQRLEQVLSIDLADKMGNWLGNCSNENCTLDLPLQTKAYFNQLGKHSFTLEQYMRIDPLPAVNSATFRIEVSKEPKN